MVTLESGKRKRISDVKIGDSVLAVDEKGIARFSQILLHMHRDPEMMQKFHVIRTKTGRNLALTNTHMIYKTKSNESNQNLKDIISSEPVFAMTIKKGDFVLVNDENNEMMKDEVVSNDVETRKGIAAPVTAFGNIVVDDILASCYVDYDHSVVHMIVAPFRWIHDARNFLSRMTKITNLGLWEQKQEPMGLHWYPNTLLNLMNDYVPEWEIDRKLKMVIKT